MELIEGQTPIFHIKLTKEQFGLTDQEAMSQDLLEEYAVCADRKANAGLIVFGKLKGTWVANPWSTRFLIRVLLEKIGIEIQNRPPTPT